MKKNPGRRQRRQMEQRNRRISHKTADIRNKVNQIRARNSKSLIRIKK